jgi:hypothetical protein
MFHVSTWSPRSFQESISCCACVWSCSYVGFVVSILLISFTRFKFLLDGKFQLPTFGAAYVMTGLVGSWLSIKLCDAVFVQD